jgi:hypothetical protein
MPVPAVILAVMFVMTLFMMLTHFWAMLSFAALVSTALACLTRRTTVERVKYGVWSFCLFILIGVGVAWLMYPFSR